MLNSTWNEIQPAIEAAQPNRFQTIICEWGEGFVGCSHRSLGGSATIEKAKAVGYQKLPEDRDTRITPGHYRGDALDFFWVVDTLEGGVPFSQVEITRMG